MVTEHIPVAWHAIFGHHRASLAWTGHPSSPDLNPIENVWAQLKRRIQRREQKAGHPARTRDKLIAIAQEVWEGIDWEGVDKAIAGMGGRIATVILRKGGHTKY